MHDLSSNVGLLVGNGLRVELGLLKLLLDSLSLKLLSLLGFGLPGFFLKFLLCDLRLSRSLFLELVLDLLFDGDLVGQNS